MNSRFSEGGFAFRNVFFDYSGMPFSGPVLLFVLVLPFIEAGTSILGRVDSRICPRNDACSVGRPSQRAERLQVELLRIHWDDNTRGPKIRLSS